MVADKDGNIVRGGVPHRFTLHFVVNKLAIDL